MSLDISPVEEAISQNISENLTTNTSALLDALSAAGSNVTSFLNETLAILTCVNVSDAIEEAVDAPTVTVVEEFIEENAAGMLSTAGNVMSNAFTGTVSFLQEHSTALTVATGALAISGGVLLTLHQRKLEQQRDTEKTTNLKGDSTLSCAEVLGTRNKNKPAPSY